MKLLDVIILVVGFCLLAMGLHQSIYVGFADSYWIFMFGIGCIFWYGYRKRSENEDDKTSKNTRKP